ncbi:MAG: NADH-quinone oxidoreductase subunit A [Spirochaetes bacterium]|nr:MAG: NADH-quinone oxidoreductase subunit A [Spirochaetota bacterium]
MPDIQSILPLAIYGVVVVVMVLGILVLSWVLGEKHHARTTGEPYESGIVPTGSSRIRFSAHYYVIAMFFVIFDLETVFLVAWSVSLREAGWYGFAGAAVFAGVIAAALVYEWRIGALEFAPGGKKILRFIAQGRRK